MDSPAVVAYKRCVALLPSISTKDFLHPFYKEKFNDMKGVFDSDEHATEDDVYEDEIDLSEIKTYVAFKVALSGLDLDVEVDGEPFYFWEGRRRYSECDSVIVAEAKNLFARRKRDGRTVAHEMLKYETGRMRIADMDRGEARALMCTRDIYGDTPMHNTEYEDVFYTTIRDVGRDLLSMFGGPGVISKKRHMVIEHFDCMHGDPDYEDDVLRCKVFVFALQRFDVRAPFLVKDGDNAILNRVGAFMFAPKPQYV